MPNSVEDRIRNRVTDILRNLSGRPEEKIQSVYSIFQPTKYVCPDYNQQYITQIKKLISDPSSSFSGSSNEVNIPEGWVECEIRMQALRFIKNIADGSNIPKPPEFMDNINVAIRVIENQEAISNEGGSTYRIGRMGAGFIGMGIANLIIAGCCATPCTLPFFFWGGTGAGCFLSGTGCSCYECCRNRSLEKKLEKYQSENTNESSSLLTTTEEQTSLLSLNNLLCVAHSGFVLRQKDITAPNQLLPGLSS